MSKESVDLDKKILNLLPIDGSEMRAKDLYAKAEAEKLVRLTVERKLVAFAKQGIIYRRQESPKKVYYSRREKIRVEHLINDFVQEIGSILSSEVPVRLDRDKRILIEGSLRKDEARYMAEMLRSNPRYLEIEIIHTVLRKIHKMVIASLPEQLKDKEYYIGAFDDRIQLHPRSTVEKALKSQEHSAKR
jgi:hypothetical protein